METKKKYIIAKLGNEEYAISIENIKEIVSYEKITPIPNADIQIEGMINLRNQIYIIYNLKNRFKIIEDHRIAIENKKILLLNNLDAGILMDEVVQILEIEDACTEALPEMKWSNSRSFIQNIIKKDGKAIINLNIGQLISQKETQDLLLNPV